MKSPRNLSIASDITGGLPKATSLFEAKNIDKKAILSDIKGVVRFGSIVRGNMELFVESKFLEQGRFRQSRELLRAFGLARS